MEPYHSTSNPSKHTPYNPLTARCPKCRAAMGRACISVRHKALRSPHQERVEYAAAEYRSGLRLQILDRARLHPFALPFSPRRMRQGNFGKRVSPESSSMEYLRQ
jgi:hypothetical protein